MEKAIAAKRKAFKTWKTTALGHHTMQPNEMPDMQCSMLVMKPTYKKVYENTDPKSSEVCLANQFRRQNADVVGDKPVKNDAGEMLIASGGSAENLHLSFSH